MADDSDTPEDADSDTTSSTDTRWKYIGTLLAGIMVASVPIAVIGGATGLLALSAIPETWFGLYSLVALMAATWAFGRETLDAVNEVRGKK